jgi:hypothetical protein
MRVLPRACAVLVVLAMHVKRQAIGTPDRRAKGTAMQDYSAVVVADQPAREADQDRRKLVSHGRYVTFQMAEVTVRDRCSPTFCP